MTDQPTTPAQPRFRVDGKDFEDAEAVNRYLVQGHSKAELIDLLMVSIKESVEREAAVLPEPTRSRIADAFQAGYEAGTAQANFEEAWRAVEAVMAADTTEMVQAIRRLASEPTE